MNDTESLGQFKFIYEENEFEAISHSIKASRADPDWWTGGKNNNKRGSGEGKLWCVVKYHEKVDR